MISGVVTEIYKKIYETAEKKRYESKAEIENASHKYDESYRARHGQIKVFCVGMRKPIPLDDVYVAVQFLDEYMASRYRSSEAVEQAFRERSGRHFGLISDERQDGTQVANSKQCLMLLGGPGVGKSTFLRKVGLEALKGKTGNFEHECIPVFLELKRFTEDQIDIAALITEEFKTCGYPHPEEMTNTALKLGKLLILLDGLDEVPTSNVANAIRKIGDFVNQYSRNRFIASCRRAAYTGGFTGFTEVEMADFNDLQIQAYINNWFDSTPDQYRHQLDEEMKTADRCWEALNTNEHRTTKELARNPLLLTLLCMVYDISQNFSRNRANLYEKALNIFLEEWAAEKRVNRGASIDQYLDIPDEIRMLSEIAEKNFKADRLFFSKSELIAQIQEFGTGNANTRELFNAPKILDTILIDQGLFVEQVMGSYSFSHLTFQEYLTANYIIGDGRSIQGLVTRHLHNEQWREVFLLTAGLMREADDLLTAMQTEAAKLINTDRLKTLFRWTEGITNTTDGRYNKIAKRLFAIHQYFSLWLLNKIDEKVKNCVTDDQDRYFYRYFYFNGYPYRNFDRDFYQDLYQSDLNRAPYRDQDLYRSLHRHIHLYRYLYRDLYRYLHLYRDLHFYRYFNKDLNPYQDFYRYMRPNFYRLVSSVYPDRFDKELEERITFTKRMEDIKIFKGVDLQRMVRRFDAQREFIKAASKRKSVKTPEESIHDTWLSVLGITNDMLAISGEELEKYLQYFRVMDLIFACKEAAGRVSPDVWQTIEDRFLTWDAGGSEG